MINICPKCKGIIGNETICPKCGVNILDYKEELEEKNVEISRNKSLKDSSENEGNDEILRTNSEICQTEFALVKCPACGRECVADNTIACPVCGFGIKAHFDKIKIEEPQKTPIVTQQKVHKQQELNIKRKALRKKKLFGSPIKKTAWISVGCIALGLFTFLGIAINSSVQREKRISELEQLIEIENDPTNTITKSELTGIWKEESTELHIGYFYFTSEGQVYYLAARVPVNESDFTSKYLLSDSYSLNDFNKVTRTKDGEFFNPAASSNGTFSVTKDSSGLLTMKVNCSSASGTYKKIADKSDSTISDVAQAREAVISKWRNSGKAYECVKFVEDIYKQYYSDDTISNIYYYVSAKREYDSYIEHPDYEGYREELERATLLIDPEYDGELSDEIQAFVKEVFPDGLPSQQHNEAVSKQNNYDTMTTAEKKKICEYIQGRYDYYDKLEGKPTGDKYSDKIWSEVMEKYGLEEWQVSVIWMNYYSY